MPGTKTSVWLGEEEHARWKASGLSLTEIVKRGLIAPGPQEVAAQTVLDAITAAEERILGAVSKVERRVEELERIASR